MNKKEAFLRQLNEAFARSNISYLLDNVTDDIRWNIVGDRNIEGKTDFQNALEDMASDEPFDLSIKTLVIQGNTSVVEGLISSPDGSTYAFLRHLYFQRSPKSENTGNDFLCNHFKSITEKKLQWIPNLIIPNPISRLMIIPYHPLHPLSMNK